MKVVTWSLRLRMYVRTYVAVWEEYCTQDQDGHSMPDIHSCTDMYPLLRSSKLSRPRTCVVCQGSWGTTESQLDQSVLQYDSKIKSILCNVLEGHNFLVCWRVKAFLSSGGLDSSGVCWKDKHLVFPRVKVLQCVKGRASSLSGALVCQSGSSKKSTRL